MSLHCCVLSSWHKLLLCPVSSSLLGRSPNFSLWHGCQGESKFLSLRSRSSIHFAGPTIVMSQIFDRYLFSYFRTFGESVVFIVGCIHSQQQTPYRRVHCQSYASSIVATRTPKLQVRSRRALWRFRRRSQNKRKIILSTSDTTAVAFV